jgi:hypothetical protein
MPKQALKNLKNLSSYAHANTERTRFAKVKDLENNMIAAVDSVSLEQIQR